MKSLSLLLFLIISFSIFFFALRAFGIYIGYDLNTLVADLGGLTYLYSTVGMIFAVFAGFVIISESQDWRTLVMASKNEVRNLNELLLWSKKLSASSEKSFSNTIKQYLMAVIDKEWKTLRNGIECVETAPIIASFHDLISLAADEDTETAAHLFSVFGEFLNNRAIRLEYSWQPMPTILKFTVFLVDIALIGLSFFIGVKNLWLDYAFMTCITTLGLVILIVIDDLDNPLRPGEWCLTSGDYQSLLNRIRNS